MTEKQRAKPGPKKQIDGKWSTTSFVIRKDQREKIQDYMHENSMNSTSQALRIMIDFFFEYAKN